MTINEQDSFFYFIFIPVGLINWKNTCRVSPLTCSSCAVVIGTVETVSWLNVECVCVPLSACSPGHVPTLFLSISVPLLLSAQCLTPESAGGQTQAIDTSFTQLTFTLLSHYTTLPFFFFFRNCVNYIVYLFMIEYDPEYHTSSIVDILYIHTLKDHKSCACVCTIWAVVVSSSSFHILLGSHRLLPLWCYCSGPFQCKQ